LTKLLVPPEHLLPLRRLYAGAPPWLVFDRRRALHGLIGNEENEEALAYEGREGLEVNWGRVRGKNVMWVGLVVSINFLSHALFI